ncbi:hypothetical protein [Acidipropionibacterium thoenii]|uniref:hypothetical protein n=1 Tax=Acidipropionibacterium thoenii TaxID=1751 RepID=UPI0003FBCEA3|nr:hypothetical protein [Acidipropionibacterium thoenii]
MFEHDAENVEQRASTGTLPPRSRVAQLVTDAHERYADLDDGEVADHIPALAGAAAPKRLAGDVGSIRGTTQNLASAVGTAVMGAVLVTTLGMRIGGAVAQHPELPESLVKQVDLDNANFISNDDLREVLARTPAGGRRCHPQRGAAAAHPQARLPAARERQRPRGTARLPAAEIPA